MEMSDIRKIEFSGDISTMLMIYVYKRWAQYNIMANFSKTEKP